MTLSRRATALALSAAVAVSASACGSSNDDQPDAVATTPASIAKAVRAADPELVKPGRPGAAIIKQWQYLKLGAVPAALLMYSPTVRNQVGINALAGAAATLQNQLAPYTPVVVKQELTGAGQLLTVDALSSSAKTVRYSYLVDRSDGQWVITYDSLMPAALIDYVRLRIQGSIDPYAKRPGRTALNAAGRAGERFRLAGLGKAASNAAP
jgi:hypothetical protein